MRRLLKWVVILGVVLGVIAGGLVMAGSWWQKHSVPKYLTAKVSRGEVETVVNSTGTVKPVLSVSVGAFTSGPIKEIYVDFNSVVKKDQLIALIDPRLAKAMVAHDEAALDAQKADLMRIEALLKQARNNEKRGEKLQAVKKDYLADTDMDNYYFTRLQYEAQLRLGKAAIEQAEATLQNSQANLGYTEIRSPVDGIVISRSVDPGQTVAASFQTPELFVIATEMDKHMYVYASVDEADIGHIRKAQQRDRFQKILTTLKLVQPEGRDAQQLDKVVKFTVDSYPDDIFEGSIYQVRMNSTTTQNVVTYPVVIEAENPGLKLRPGMTANISFRLESKKDALRVPSAALRFVPTSAQVHPDDRHYLEAAPVNKSEGSPIRSATEKAELNKKRQHRIVWKQDGQFLRAVPVTLGLIDSQYAEVLEGDVAEDQELAIGLDTAKG
jgi:HlyD family secretion protein